MIPTDLPSAVADVYEALTSDRPYRPALTSEDAIDIIHLDVPGRLDADVCGALETVLERQAAR